jgi:hypothetical protein
MKFGAKIMRLRAKLRQRREEKRNKITNKKMPFLRRGINGIGWKINVGKVKNGRRSYVNN